MKDPDKWASKALPALRALWDRKGPEEKLDPKVRKELQALKEYQESLEQRAHRVAMGLTERRDLLARLALLDPPDLA